MLSRLLSAPIVVLALAAPALAEVSARHFPAAFEALDETQRRTVQQELQTAGLYGGSIDGRYGPGTERALIQAVDRIVGDGFHGIAIFLDTEADAISFMFTLAEGGYSKWLYGEGDENDGG
ncbi:peptidoglycan-binding domain-containing protein [Frigidibacter sp. ROC022]|uniref:peptidoglycan-binding domain-containing protein n=1 Tax=Frigidibacter sp. ROC022 TaxID=2971796 RepID=UPI00215AF6B5|nr:peptidoglycan-binding domain-containing protein [Frigidibacter sp. ROC022]MCR8725352.1 peptidoglycan-binding protein [Frigidibacter sp. ROC022]